MSRTATFLALATLLVTLALAMPAQHPPQPMPPLANEPAPTVTSEGLSLRVQSDHQLLSSNGGDLTVQVDVKSLAGRSSVAPINIVLVLDRSGSMSGDKLEQAKSAARALVAKLGESDQFGLVHFGSDVTKFDLRPMTARGQAEALAVIDSIAADGGTNLGAALSAGSAMLAHAAGSRRLVLASDGEPTVGLQSSAELVQVVQQVHAQHITVTALGIGADYNGPLMTRLAEVGGGSYGYLRSAGQLSEILAQEIAQARAVSLENVRVTLIPGDGVSVVEVSGRELLNSEVFLPDLKENDEARLFVRLHAGASGADVRKLLTSRVTWHSVDDAFVHSAQTEAQVKVTHDALAAANSRDEVVFANAVTAEASTKLVQVAAAIDRGDRDTALSLFGNVRALFGTSANALAGSAEVLDLTEHTLRNAQGDEMRHAARGIESKALKSFGENNAY